MAVLVNLGTGLLSPPEGEGAKGATFATRSPPAAAGHIRVPDQGTDLGTGLLSPPEGEGAKGATFATRSPPAAAGHIRVPDQGTDLGTGLLSPPEGEGAKGATFATRSPPAAAGYIPDPIPLVVDLDDTLLQTDSMIESMFVMARQHPASVLHWPAWMARGRAEFKHRLASVAMPQAHTLPYRAEVLEFLREQQQQGRKLVLATGADAALARELVCKLNLFDTILASQGTINLSGERKRDRLIAEFGMRGFDYIGNAWRDMPVWSAARRALLVSSSERLARSVAAITPVERIFSASAHWTDYLDALRPLHWVKNSLVFVPLFAAHRMLEVEDLARASMAFVAFCLCASSIYLLNDFFDLPADRLHPHKQERKLASGGIRLLPAFALMLLLAFGAFIIGLQLSLGVMAVLGGYFSSMAAYSLKLKIVPVLDVLMLSGGYALRVTAGALAVGVPLSPWLIALCICLFLSLALVKRYTELLVMEGIEGGAARARGYVSGDRFVLLAQGVSSGYLAVLVLALYIVADIPHGLYSHPQLLWLLCLLLLHWVSYVWLMAARGCMHHDPVIFAIKDPRSRWQLLVMTAVAVLSL